MDHGHPGSGPTTLKDVLLLKGVFSGSLHPHNVDRRRKQSDRATVLTSLLGLASWRAGAEFCVLTLTEVMNS